MSNFKTAVKDDNIADKGDTIAASPYSVPDTGIYDAVIEHAIYHVSKGGAKGIRFRMKLSTGQTHNEDLWILNKEGVNYYENKGVKSYLQGFTNCNDLANIILDTDISDVDTEEVDIMLYDYEASRDVMQTVECFKEFHGEEIKIGLIKKKEFKQKQSQSGAWEAYDVNETKESATINKVFFSDGLTVAEDVSDITTPVFIDTWLERNPSTWVRDSTLKGIPGKSKASSGSPKSRTPRAAASVTSEPKPERAKRAPRARTSPVEGDSDE